MADNTARRKYICQSCGKEFLGWIYKNRKFCSLHCSGSNPLIRLHRSEKLTLLSCLTCGKMFHPRPSAVRSGKGKYCSLSCSSSNQIRKYGCDNPNWRGGITTIHEKIRKSLEYEEWRIKVFERDLYTCQCCGQIGGKLNADHIKPFALYPELRLDINNGRTLCEKCHWKIGAKVNQIGLIGEANYE